ncbi:Glycosyl transferase family 2 [uncultured archaeon]|nr:Glycosyl transferase family 2 [uncultured archaeon]
MRVSIIILYVASGPLLDEAVKSAENQTLPPYEVIAEHDPGRTGIAATRNRALAKATGDAFVPLDSDDWVEPTFLEKTVPLLVGAVGIVSTAFEYHGIHDGLIMAAYSRTLREQLCSNNICGCSLVDRRAYDAAGPYDGFIPGWEDWDMWIRILKAGWTHEVVNEPLFHYRLTNTGMNAYASARKAENRAKMREKHGEGEYYA